MIIFYGKRVIYYDSQLFQILIKIRGTGRLVELKSSVRKNGGENKCLVFIVHFVQNCMITQNLLAIL